MVNDQVRESDLDRPVLFAYDGSDHAKSAIEQAGRDLRTPRSAVVVTVWQPFASIPYWGIAYGRVPDEFVESVERSAMETAEEGVALAREAGFDPEPVATEGTPIWERILDIGKKADAGLIVTGSHGRTGISYVALGSVAAAVLHHAEVPVLVARLAGGR